MLIFVIDFLFLRKMVMCFVPDCKHYSEQKICKFFVFPANPEERKAWIQLIRYGKKQISCTLFSFCLIVYTHTHKRYLYLFLYSRLIVIKSYVTFIYLTEGKIENLQNILWFAVAILRIKIGRIDQPSLSSTRKENWTSPLLKRGIVKSFILCYLYHFPKFI